MAAGLGTLVENLDKSSCSNMSSFYKGQKLDLLLRKGVYPYDYINSITKLDETSLPPISHYLNEQGTGDEFIRINAITKLSL